MSAVQVILSPLESEVPIVGSWCDHLGFCGKITSKSTSAHSSQKGSGGALVSLCTTGR